MQERVKAALYNTSPEGAGNAPTATVGESALLSRAGSNVAGSGPTATVGESALLSLAGSSAQQSNIRAVINRDNAIFAEEDGNFVDALIFWRDPQDSGTIVDPAREDQRLQEAEATGEAPNAGPEVCRLRGEALGSLDGNRQLQPGIRRPRRRKPGFAPTGRGRLGRCRTKPALHVARRGVLRDPRPGDRPVRACSSPLSAGP